MISEKMVRLGTHKSVIREIFEYSKKRAEEIGKENVFDFSIGNPSVPAPVMIRETIKELLDTENDIELFGYTSAQGTLELRKAISDNLNLRFGTGFNPENFYITCGAAAGLRILMEALTVPGDEYIIFTPYFPEYRVFVESAGGIFVESKSEPDTFQIDFDYLEKVITVHTKAVFVNSPNNPSGVVLSLETIKRLASLLHSKQEEYGHEIYLIGDEPYRELVYDDIEVPYLTKYYPNTIICYSYSKSLSLPGERIGFILVPDVVEHGKEIYAAVCGAGRALGYVCAPSLIQHVVAECMGQVSDLSIYKRNRDLLYEALISYGYECIYPDGAFYLFVKTMIPDALKFCEYAKKYELLLVPGDDFGCPGYVRIAYCVSTEQIERALPYFKQLADDYVKGVNI